jgi:hypothetical protein
MGDRFDCVEDVVSAVVVADYADRHRDFLFFLSVEDAEHHWLPSAAPYTRFNLDPELSRKCRARVIHRGHDSREGRSSPTGK